MLLCYCPACPPLPLRPSNAAQKEQRRHTASIAAPILGVPGRLLCLNGDVLGATRLPPPPHQPPQRGTHCARAWRVHLGRCGVMSVEGAGDMCTDLGIWHDLQDQKEGCRAGVRYGGCLDVTSERQSLSEMKASTAANKNAPEHATFLCCVCSSCQPPVHTNQRKSPCLPQLKPHSPTSSATS